MNASRHVATLVVVLPALVLPLFPAAPEPLEYRRSAILDGEFWRLFTGHWIHWSWSHLFWNVALIAIVGVLIERQSRAQWWCLVGGAASGIGVGLFLLEPDLARYAGLSGLAAAGVSWLVIRNAGSRTGPRGLWMAIGLLLLAKIVVELFDPTPWLARGGESNFRSVPEAHLLGVLIGAGVALLDLRGWVTPAGLAATSARCP